MPAVTGAVTRLEKAALVGTFEDMRAFWEALELVTDREIDLDIDTGKRNASNKPSDPEEIPHEWRRLAETNNQTDAYLYEWATEKQIAGW